MLLIVIVLVSIGVIFYFKSKEREDIYFISKNELLDLEKSRIEQISNSKMRQIFDGRIQEAFNIVRKEALYREERGHRIIFAEGRLVGKNLYSISKEVHDKILDSLSLK